MPSTEKHKIFDAIIIGGGPAGINCALELSYCNIECLVITREERLGGQLWEVGELMNFAGGYFKTGAELASSIEQVSAKAKIQILRGKQVEKIDASSKTIFVPGESLQARTILISTGLRLKRLDLPGMSQFASDIFYRDEKSVSAYANLKVAVMGGGDNALMKAIDLAQVTDHVYLLNRSNKWRARSEFLESVKNNARIEIIENTELQSLAGASTLNSARLIDKDSHRVRTIQIDKLFVKIGYTPNTEPFQGQLAMDEQGHIIVDKNRASEVAGIFAAGDVASDTCPRVATACGDGANAAESMQIYLGRRLGK